MFLGNEFHLHGCLVQSSPVQIEAFESIENAFGRATLFFLLLSTSIVMPIGEFVIVRLIVVVIVGCCDGNRWLWSDGDGFLTHVRAVVVVLLARESVARACWPWLRTRSRRGSMPMLLLRRCVEKKRFIRRIVQLHDHRRLPCRRLPIVLVFGQRLVAMHAGLAHLLP